MRTLVLVARAAILATAATGRAAEGDAADFTKRGPLDRHAEYVRQVLDTLELSDDQQRQLARFLADGHAAWRLWFKENHEKVAAHNPQPTRCRSKRGGGDIRTRIPQ
jgi:hypothetical protein